MVKFIDNRPQKAGIAGLYRRRRQRTNKGSEPYYKASNGQTIFQSIDEFDFEFSENLEASSSISPANEASVDRAVEENSSIAASKHLAKQDREFGSSSAAAAQRNEQEDTACSTAEKQQQQIEFLMEQLRQREAELTQLQKEKLSAFSSRDPAARHPPPLFEARLDIVGECRKASTEDSVRSGTASKIEEVVRSPPRAMPPVSRKLSDSATNHTLVSADVALSPFEASPRTKLFGSSQHQQSPQSEQQSPSTSLAVTASERDFVHHQRVDAQFGGDDAMLVDPRHQPMVSILSHDWTKDREKAHRTEIQSLMNKHTHLLASVASQYRTQILTLEAEKTRLHQTACRRSDELETAIKEHQEAIESLVAKHTKDIHYLNKAHREAATALSLQRENDLAERGRKHNAELEAARVQAVKERQSFRTQLCEEVTLASMALREEHRLEMEQTEVHHADEVKALKDEVAAWKGKAKQHSIISYDLAKQLGKLNKNSTCLSSQKISMVGVDAKAFDPRRLPPRLSRSSPSLLENLKESSPPAKQNKRRGTRDQDEIGQHTPVDETRRSETSPRKKRRAPPRDDDLLARESLPRKRRPTDVTYSGIPIAVCARHRGGKSHTTLVIHSPLRDEDQEYL